MPRRSKHLAKCKVSNERPWTLGELIVMEALATIRCSSYVIADQLDRADAEVLRMRIAMGLPPSQPYTLFEQRRITANEWQQLVAMHADGVYLTEMARRLGVCHYVAKRWLDEAGLVPHRFDPKARVRQRDARIIELRKARHSFREIVRIMDQPDCTVGAVAGVCHRAGLCRPKKGKKNGTNAQHATGSGRGSSQAASQGDGGQHQGANP